MANQNLYRLLGGTLCAAATMLFAVSAPAQQKSTKIGDYTLSNYGEIQIQSARNGDLEVTMVGQKGVPMQANSPSYDLTAPRIELSFKGKKLKPTRVIASGGVKIVNRDKINNRKTIITCNETRYASTTDSTDKGVINLVGNVRSEVQGIPSAVGPIVATGDSGTVQFPATGGLSVVLRAEGGNGTIKGQGYEPAPKGKQP